MKNLIGAVPMATMAQSAAKWHTHVDRTLSLTHLHQYSYNHFVRNAISAITESGFEFYFECTWGRGSKAEYPQKTPDSLPANWYNNNNNNNNNNEEL